MERLTFAVGICGVRGVRRVSNTVADTTALRQAYTPDPDFTVTQRTLWRVADFTYMPKWSGFVCVTLILDVVSRRIVGWLDVDRTSSPLDLGALEHALWSRAREGVTDLPALINYHDVAVNTPRSPSPSG